MVVAFGTTQAQAEKHLAADVSHFVQDGGPVSSHVSLVVFVEVQPPQRGGNPSVWIVRVDFVSGNLLGDELRVGLIGVERSNDVVAISPQVRSEVVLAIPVRF